MKQDWESSMLEKPREISIEDCGREGLIRSIIAEKNKTNKPPIEE